MSESHLHYYPDHGSSLPEYLHEGIPEVEESYSMSYQTSTSTNGHGESETNPVLFVSPNSQSSVPVDASLISRSQSQTKTEQVKTVTKVIKTREILGPDGKPINYAYGTLPHARGPHPKEYLGYPANFPDYEQGRPQSPAAQAPTELYSDYGTCRTASPASAPSGRNFDLYSLPSSQGVYNYSPQIVTAAHTPSELLSDSPNLHRAMPQAPRTVYSKEPGNYEDIDASPVVPQNRIDYRQTPSPPLETADRYGTYGYTAQIPATSPRGYFDPGSAILPEGFLDHLKGSPVPPHISHQHLEYPQLDSSGSGDVRFRDPDLHEVIEFLQHPNNVVRANAAAYLQHLVYNNDCMKKKAKSLGGIEALIELLNEDPEISRNALGALRNLSYGRGNDENKKAILNSGGLPSLVRLLRKSGGNPDSDISEMVTSVLWNLSSCEELKHPIIDYALNDLVNIVIVPLSGYDRSKSPLDPIKQNTEIYFSTVFRNATGVLRNVSSAGLYARKKMRECDGLVEAMVFLIKAAFGKAEQDNKSVANCTCVLRNLSYRVEEIEDEEYDKHYKQVESKATAPIRAIFPSLAVGENLGCFSVKKKANSHPENSEKERKTTPALTKNPISSESVRGAQLLYQPEVCQCYLSLLSECSNPETLEACAGAIQNLTACFFQPSIELRSTVRREKGLPVLVELLRMQHDGVVAAVATALRNLSQDQRNRELIGNYALKDLINKLPGSEHDAATSDNTIAAILATLNEVLAKQTDFARSFFQLGGVEKLNRIVKEKGTYSTRVCKFASQLLFNLYMHDELRAEFKKAGYKESNFIPKSYMTPLVRNSISSPTGANSTLNRPVSSIGSTKYEDRTLPHGNELNSTAASIPYSRSEELPLSELSHNSEPPSQIHRPHMGAFPPGMQQIRSPSEPVYAQVNRERKKGRHSDIPVQLLSKDQPDGMPAGDSWV